MILILTLQVSDNLPGRESKMMAPEAEKLQNPPKNIAGRYIYVAANGSNSNDGSEPSKPFLLIQQAISIAMPGDTIKLADGDYHESIVSVRSGSADKPIIIEGTQKATLYGNSSRIIEINHDYIYLGGFHVNGKFTKANKKDSFRDKLIYVIGKKPREGVSGLRIYNMLVENAGGECIRLRYFAKNNEISNTTIKDCGVYDFRYKDGGKNGEGIYIGTAPEQLQDGKNPNADRDESNNNWIHDNSIETNGNECVDVKESAHHNLIENNFCTGQKDPKSGGLDSRGHTNVFRYNIIEGNKGAGVRLGGDEQDDGINNDVYENRIKNNDAGGIRLQRTPQAKICGNTFENNGDAEVIGVSASMYRASKPC